MAGAPNFCSTVKLFQTMCKLRHALPRIFIRLRGTRHSRARVATWPGQFSQSRTSSRSVHGRGPVTHISQTSRVHIRSQSAVAFNPRPPQRPWTVHAPATGRTMANPWIVHEQDLSASLTKPCPGTVRDQATTRHWPVTVRAGATNFPTMANL
jgi:hypothetical protein